MKGIQKNKAHKTDPPLPGCLGRMVSLFDLTAGMSTNRLLMDKPHITGSALRTQSDAVRILDIPAGNKLDAKMVYPDLRNFPVRNSNSTSMKTLIAEELSKEVESKNGPPNVIAKLMGLDALPQQQHGVVMKTAQSEDCSHSFLNHSGGAAEHWNQEHDFLDRRMKWKAREYEDHGHYRDAYEVQKEYKRTNSMRENPPQGGPYGDKEMKKMELVRQKFIEAKRLASNEKLCQSKEFQDAVEVLSSNKEYFLKFLEEPNALISQNLYGLESSFSPPETKRITVLRPSRMVELEKFPSRRKKKECLINRSSQVLQDTNPRFVDERGNQPTQIVVLKPNAGKMSEMKSCFSLSLTSPRILHGENTFEDEDYRTVASREMIEENICHAQRKLLSDQEDETLMSFEKTENQYASGSYDDLEVMSPWHSWDCVNVNGFESPFSSSSFSRISYTPNSLVCREAKKHLSERWAMMSSSRGTQGRRSQRSSNTLGEMLALSETKKHVISNEECNAREVSSTIIADKAHAANVPEDLQMSKCLPASSMEHGQKIYFQQSVQEACKTNTYKEPTKKSSPSSFKGKISSFFFMRNKRSSKDRCFPTLSTEESQSAASDTPESPLPAYRHDEDTYYVNQFDEDSDIGVEECSSGIDFSGKSFLYLSQMQKNKGVASEEGDISNLKTASLGNSIENPDQPSPISVLELPYEDDDTATAESSGKHLPVHHHLMSNLINKSPHIGSVARTLSWDDSCSGSLSPDSSDPASRELFEQDWLLLVKKILSAAGIDGQTPGDTLSFNGHSLDGPLDPSLRDKLVNTEELDMMHESFRRQRKTYCKLAIDCVSEALSRITSHILEPVGPQRAKLLSGKPSSTLLDQIMTMVREWLFHKMSAGEYDGLSLAVEMTVRDEVGGGGWWAKNFSLEVSNLGMEMEQELIGVLVDEALIDLQ